jgi:hypothetical protein
MSPVRSAAFILALVLAAPAPAQEEVDVKPALAAAEAWLGLLDAGRLGEGWDQATAALQEAIPRPRWEIAMVASREKLGSMHGRKLRSATFTRGKTPEEDYVIIEYDTRFELRPLTVEVVTPQRGPGNAWKVSNYIIR